MKILFVSLDVDNKHEYSSAYFPLGLSILAEITANMGIDTALFDINKYLYEHKCHTDILEEVTSEFAKVEPDIIGYFTRCDLLPSVINSAKLVKQKLLNSFIFLGGPGVYGNEKSILKNFEFIDLIIRGEGEKTIKRLLSGVPPENIPGIAYKTDDKIVINQDVDLIEDLDTVPMLTREGKIKENDTLQIEAGRGCPYNCSFCSTSGYWRRKYRVQSPKRIIDEIESLQKKHRNVTYTFLHDNLTVSEEYVESLVTEIKKRSLHFSWGCCARIDNVNEKIIRFLKDGGCEHIYFGIESGSERMQKIIGKNILLSTIYKNMELCDKYDIDTTQSYVLGFPEETSDDINATLNLAIELANHSSSKMVQLSYLQPTPGTRVTIDNFDKLYFDENQILLLLNRNGDKLPGLEMDLSLIKKYPEIFSSYYKIQLNHSFDLYRAVYCFSHLIVYYKKTLNIICKVYNIQPIDLFLYISKKCEDCTCHINAIDVTMGGNGVCQNMCSIISKLLPNMTTLEKYIIEFETKKRNTSIKSEYCTHK